MPAGASRTGDRLGASALLAVGSGLLYAASLPPLGWWPAGWIALAPLCVAASWLGPARAALVGLLAGSVAGALVSPWLPGMLTDYFLATGALVWVASLGAWVLCGGIYFGLFAAWLSWALARGGASPLLVGGAWWLCEWARAHGIVPNPWALLGYSQMEWPLTAQIADIAGPYGIGAVLAATAAVLAGRVTPGLRAARPRAAAVSLGAIVAVQLAYGAVRLHADEASAPALRVGLVQGAVPQDQRFEPSHVAANLERHLELTREASSGGAALVAWPELALDFYVEHDPRLRARLLRATRDLGVELLAGGLGVSVSEGQRRRTNSVFLVKEGRIRARYDKVWPMPFSEAMPLRGWLANGPDPIHAGAVPQLLSSSFARIGVATCSEAMHPGYVRRLALDGAELLLSPSNDGWFGSRSAALQQLRAASMRAIETRRYLLRPTASGYTAVIDPQGRVVAQAPYGEPALLSAIARPETELTIYARLGDTTALVPLVFVGVDAFVRRRREPRASKA